MYLSTRTKAIIALLVAGTLGGVSPLFIKIALKEFSSYQILFIRFSIALLFISPLLIKHIKTLSLKKIKHIVPAGLLFSGNMFFFVVGIQFTTSIVSQLFFLLTPVIVSLVGYFLFKERISIKRIISMLICFGGSSLLVMRSMQGSNLVRSIGTFQGNILILCGVASWSFYLIYTKRISKTFDPSLFLVSNFFIVVVVSIACLFITNTSIITTIVQFGRSSLPVMSSLIALATVNSVLFFFLYQWSIKHISAFIVACVTFISPVSAALFAIPFFGEQLSLTLLISAGSIFLGSYLILSEKK